MGCSFLLENRLSNRPRFNCEEVGEGCGDVCEGVPRFEVAGFGFAVGDERDLFAGVIGSWPSGVVAVVGRDDEQIVLVNPREKSAEPVIEGGERLSVSLRVAAVAVEHVKVAEVGEEERTFHLGGGPRGAQSFPSLRCWIWWDAIR